MVRRWRQSHVEPDSQLDAGGSVVPINITNTDVVNINDAIFGPLWGQTLNISGSVTCGFGAFVWGDMNGPVTTLNVRSNANVSFNNTLALGTAWWFPGGPHVVMNVYSNAFVGVGWLQFGARMNLYGGTVSVTNDLNTGTATGPVFAGGLDTDATRSINLIAGSTLVLPTGYTAAVNDWISRGILWVYSSPAAASQIVIDEASVDWPGRTVVTTTATGPTVITNVHLQVLRTNMYVGGLQQAQVFADYASATNVNVTATATNLIYQSSATNVVAISATGRIRAMGNGVATVTAIIGTLSNSVPVIVATYTNTAALLHRYSFSEANGSTTAADSVGGLAWDGTLNGGASFDGTGELVLDGVDGYVQLPAGIITNMDAVTVETWTTFGSNGTWSVLFTFGDTTGTAGFNYLSFQPHTGGNTAQSGIKNATTEQNPFFTPVLDYYTNVHIVAVFHPEAGYCSIYTNGILAAINSSILITMPEVTATGDPYNYIGRSLWSADPYLPATMQEFRIYSGPLTPGQIAADYALGPNQLIGPNMNVSLTAGLSGANIAIRWPTNSALVNLMSSATLGSGAVWNQANGTVAVSGTNYQMLVPASASAAFFRLQK
jgi:hypothetical protein